MQTGEMAQHTSTPLKIQSDHLRDPSRTFPALAVNIAEAAKMIGVSEDTIRREIDRGKLKGVRIGRVWRIRVSELEAYLRRCEVGT